MTILEMPTSGEMNDAVTKLEAIKQQMLGSGAVDNELSQIDSIKKEMLAGGITAQEALEQANLIIENRQDYH